MKHGMQHELRHEAGPKVGMEIAEVPARESARVFTSVAGVATSVRAYVAASGVQATSTSRGIAQGTSRVIIVVNHCNK